MTAATSYVRLKHALSALALDAVRGRPDARAAARWLEALWDDRQAVPEGPSDPGLRRLLRDGHPVIRVAERNLSPGLRRLLRDGLIERRAGAVVFPAACRPHEAYARRQALRLGQALRALAVAPRRRGRRATVARGVALFNAGLFFACHEFFEDLWRRAPAGDRAFFQGIILVAAAFYHYEKGNGHGARVKLVEGTKRLRRCPPVRWGVRVDRWLQALEPWLVRVERGEAGRPLEAGEIPQIPLLDDSHRAQRHPRG